MLTSIFLLLLNVLFGFFTLVLLGRFYMQWQRISFHNQVGVFILKTTDWVVLPLRRMMPGLFGLDMASLLPAWGLQTLHAAIDLGVRGLSFDGGVAGVTLGLIGLGLVELARMAVYLLFVIVLASAVMSWVSPHAPAAPIFRGLAEPFLRPFRRVIPMVANIDLSPLVFLVLMQIVLIVLTGLRGNFVVLVAGV